VPACVTVKVWPPTAIVPVLADVVRLAATLKPIAPGPEPLQPEVIVIQAALAVAVQVHPAPDVIVIVPVPPAEETD
jgi:hypothetical protein